METGEATSESMERLRRRLLDAAQRIVERAGGVSVTLDITLDMVMKEAGVSRTSLYRAWPRKEEFEVDLLCDLAGPSWQGTAAFDEETILLARNVVAERLELLQTSGGREQLLREIVRRAANQNFSALVASAQWRTYVALTATILSMPDEDRRTRVRDSLQQAEAVFIQHMAVFYEGMSAILGYRLREPDLGFERLAAVGAAVVEGLGLRQLISAATVDAPLILEGPNGPEEWSLAAYGFFGVINQMIEPDPGYDVTTALTDYLKSLAQQEVSSE
ncbi:TetR/AcrR family transcriptional regulator [Pedococcus bigeumensis]|uniref:TetR/AcrR family transcriptional regulator n=2 Tax=Pedococcus bigeumensis TaxID=433644 RepID=A0A502CLE9_9MICO|nr:TetR/AcrR family transcriptional regulator [Pedococcus bigeumensis]